MGAVPERTDKRPDVRIRPAERGDCRPIAELFLIASDGLARYIWSRANPAGLPLLEVGAQRYAREDAAFSYRNCMVAEVDGAVAGFLHSFPMHPQYVEDAHAIPDPVLQPYSELEDYGSLYISAVAVFEQFRGLGIGSHLLADAQSRARRFECPRLSLICFEHNLGAMNLYRRLGYQESNRRPIVPHPCLRYTEGDAVLLVRPVTGLEQCNQPETIDAEIQTRAAAAER